MPVSYLEMELLHAGQLSCGGTALCRSAILWWNCCMPVSYLEVECCMPVSYLQMELLHAGQLS
jgi:hypothetical protein